MAAAAASAYTRRKFAGRRTTAAPHRAAPEPIGANSRPAPRPRLTRAAAGRRQRLQQRRSSRQLLPRGLRLPRGWDESETASLCERARHLIAAPASRGRGLRPARPLRRPSAAEGPRWRKPRRQPCDLRPPVRLRGGRVQGHAGAQCSGIRPDVSSASSSPVAHSAMSALCGNCRSAATAASRPPALLTASSPRSAWQGHRAPRNPRRLCGSPADTRHANSRTAGATTAAVAACLAATGVVRAATSSSINSASDSSSPAQRPRLMKACLLRARAVPRLTFAGNGGQNGEQIARDGRRALNAAERVKQRACSRTRRLGERAVRSQAEERGGGRLDHGSIGGPARNGAKESVSGRHGVAHRSCDRLVSKQASAERCQSRPRRRTSRNQAARDAGSRSDQRSVPAVQGGERVGKCTRRQ